MFKAHEMEEGNSRGDVDLIVEDTLAERFFFIQVKYIRNAGKPFVLGDVEYITNKKIHKSINQLKAAADYHKSGMLSHVMEQRGISNCTMENTIFAVVTNIVNLDFQKDFEGNIVFYEWNSFRNLLMNGRCVYGETDNMWAQKEWQNDDPLPLDKPGDVIDILLQNSPALKKTNAKSIFYSKHLKTNFSLFGISYNSLGLGM